MIEIVIPTISLPGIIFPLIPLFIVAGICIFIYLTTGDSLLPSLLFLTIICAYVCTIITLLFIPNEYGIQMVNITFGGGK